MKIRSLVTAVFCFMCFTVLSGCGSSDPAKTDLNDRPESVISEADGKETGNDTEDKKKPSVNEKKQENTSDGSSLAQRMAGKYSYHYSDEDGNDEFYIMDVVPFGENLYAFCGQAMPDDQETLDAYTFWAAEFIPYDADEMKGTDNDTVDVNELCFSVMSNAGKYWDAGHKGTITLTDDGLIFEGFDHDGFLVPDNDDSRLFLRDNRVEDAFGYLRDDKGNDELEGLWILDRNGADLYLLFSGANMYIYSKDPGSEVYYAAGGCDFSDGTFSCTTSRLGYGGMPLELSCDYKVDGDTLTLKIKETDMMDEISVSGKYKRIRDGRAHVTTMDEVELGLESLSFLDSYQNIDALKEQDYYGVFVSSAKSSAGLIPTINKLEEAGFDTNSTVYTPDFSGLNPEPYYVVTAGLYKSESDAREALSGIKTAGFKDAYVKYAGTYTGDKYLYVMHDGGNITELKDGVLLRGVSLNIPYNTDGEPVTADLLVTDETVFDSSAEMEFFGNCEKGDTPYEWIVKNYNLMKEDPDEYMADGPALSGVFEVSLNDNKIMAYYGSYWWD